MNLAALRNAGAALAAAPAVPLDPRIDAMRRATDPAYDALRSAQEDWQAGRRGDHGEKSVRARGIAPPSAGAWPRCGDCGARRSPTANDPCAACGSTQPPDLSFMNPRAARMIGQAGMR